MGTKYTTIGNREGLQSQINSMKKVLENPVAWDKIQGKEAFKQQISKQEEHLAEVTPPDLTPEQRDQYIKRISLLEEAIIKGRPKSGIPPMPSEREMWSASAGAVGKHLSHETFWKNHTLDEKGNIVRAANGKGALFEWKDRARTLGKGSEHLDPDISNIDRIRPRDNSGDSNLIDYRRWSFAPGRFMAPDEYDAALERSEEDISPMEAKVRAGEKELEHKNKVEALLKLAEKDPDFMKLISQLTGEVAEELEELKESVSPTECQKITARGTGCKIKPEPGQQYCRIHLKSLKKE